METENKAIIYCALGKSESTGKYSAIISDTSLDRDNEFMSKELLQLWADDPDSIPMLMDHENRLENLLGKWTNKKVIQNGEDYALHMEPVFYESNPKSKMVKGLIDEGAKIGTSIGAIPLDSVKSKKYGKEAKKWTKAELLEASITPIPANRNSYLNLAKSFNLEGKNMTDEAEETPKVEETPAVEEPKVEETVEEKTEETTEETVEEPKEEETTEPAEETKPEEKSVKLSTEKSHEKRSELKAIVEQTGTVKAVLKPADIFEAVGLKMGVKPNNEWRKLI